MTRFFLLLFVMCLAGICSGQSVAKYAFVMATAEPVDEKISSTVFLIDSLVKNYDGTYQKQSELKSKVCAVLEKKAIATVQPCTFITYCALFVHDDYFTPGRNVVFTTQKAAQDDLDAYISLFKSNNKTLPVIQF